MAGAEDVTAKAVGPFLLQRTLGKGQTGKSDGERGREGEGGRGRGREGGGGRGRVRERERETDKGKKD